MGLATLTNKQTNEHEILSAHLIQLRYQVLPCYSIMIVM